MMMSGGLDSTTVAALAARRLSETGVQNSLWALSYVFDELSSCDERPFMAAMYAQHPIEAVYVPGDDAWPLRQVETWPVNPNAAEGNPYRWLKERIYHAAQYRGSRVMLTGIFGDELYSGAEYWLCDFLREGCFEQAWQESLWHLRTPECWGFLRNALLSCLPGVQWLRRVRRQQHRPWLTAYARSCMPVDDAWSIRVQAARRPSQFDILLGPSSANDSVGEIFHASRCGVELRHPYRDRRLVEFMLAIPASQLYRRGRYKYMLRNAMRKTLPEQIRTRKEPTSLVPLFRRGLVEKEQATVKRLLSGSNQLWPRYVRADWLTQAVPGHYRSEAEELVLWFCICCELWRMRVNGEVANGSSSS